MRWEALSPQPGADTLSAQAPWLTVYEMPSIAYRESADFKGLDGQSEPTKELLEGIFRCARFDTRFYEEVQDFEPEKKEGGRGKDAKRFLISAALEPPEGGEKDFDAWYRDEHLPVLAAAPGYVRTRRYNLVSGTSLNEFERSVPDIPQFLALHEFECEELPWTELGASAETEWAGRVMGGLAKSEIGWFVGKRVYGEGEWDNR